MSEGTQSELLRRLTSSRHRMDARKSFRVIRACEGGRLIFDPVVVVENYINRSVRITS